MEGSKIGANIHPHLVEKAAVGVRQNWAIILVLTTCGTRIGGGNKEQVPKASEFESDTEGVVQGREILDYCTSGANTTLRGKNLASHRKCRIELQKRQVYLG